MTSSTMLVRSAVPPRALLPSLERELRAASPAVPISDTGTLDEVVANLLLPQRLGVWLLGGFSLLAVGVAALGIFGVVAYGVTQRRREIGIRMALGAGTPAVLRLVLGRNLGFVSLGIVAGLAGAALSMRIAESFLYGVPALDLPTYAVTAAVLLAAAMFAAYLPARGATKVSPTIALSED
jgi:ABC-type antimicrobial peptide transport system permease subunit